MQSMGLVRALVLAVSFACTIGSASCLSYPDTSERLDDDIVLTRFDGKASFGSYSTFTIRPDVPLIDGSDAPKLLDQTAATTLVEAVARNLISRGYVRLGHDEAADLGLELSITTEVNTQRVCYSSGYYRGYGSPYWGYSGYSYYAPYGCTTSAWTSGTVLIDLLDLRAAAANGAAPDAGTPPPLPAIWLAAVYRVLSTTAPANLAQAQAGIDQAFRQSPYLQKGSK
jgi:hypothetical protein